MRNLFLLACALSAIAVPALAQDGSEPTEKRTAEGAQKFLAEYYAAQPVRAFVMTFNNGKGWQLEYSASTPGSAATMRYAIAGLQSLQVQDRCKSTLALADLRRTIGIRGQEYGELFAPGSAVAVVIDWSTVSKIATQAEMMREVRGGPEVHTGSYAVTFSPDGLVANVRLIHRTEEEAKRAAFAMQFLAEQCGFKTETGF